MGYVSGWDSKRELLAHLRTVFGEQTYRVVREAVVGNHFWFVSENGATAERSIVLCLLSGKFPRDRCGPWGYKVMGESEHPFYYDCPLAMLDLAPEASREWREGVRAYHRAKNRRFAPSEVVWLPEGYTPRSFVVTSDTPLRGRPLGSGPEGRIYRLPRTKILEAEAAAPYVGTTYNREGKAVTVVVPGPDIKA